MSQTIRFHLDENVSSSITDGLRRRGIDVTTTPEQNLIAASDEEQLRFAHGQKRVIFTQDRDFLSLHNAGYEHGGIAYCVKGSRSVSEILRGLILIWEVLDKAEMIGKIEFL
ncbi:MAG: hypothetical protein F6K19_08395 [Cyanothece sp. SIO1E1]|nr:hypothetical protein [Cyanothece sp. SIO1E1]